MIIKNFMGTKQALESVFAELFTMTAKQSVVDYILGKYQNCHLVPEGSFWFFFVLFLVLLFFFPWPCLSSKPWSSGHPVTLIH